MTEELSENKAGKIDHVQSSSNMRIDNHIKPWSKYFNIKNRHNEFTAISTEWAKVIGYRNPIDILGATAYEMRCPVVELADAFCEQDKEIITTNSTKKYIMLAMSDTKEIKPHIYEKMCIGDSVFTNHRPLESGQFASYFSERITTIDRKYYSKIQKCYELVDCYEGLSIRESEIMYYLMLGLSSTEIGGILFLSKRTIQNHVERMKIKLNTQTVRHLIELGLYLSYNTRIPERIMY